MADSKELSIKVTTTADTSGVEKAKIAVKDLNAEAKKQVQDSSELSAAGKKYADSLKGGTEEGEKFKLTHRDIRFVTRQLAKDMPELGHIVSELANPWVGLTFAIAATVGKMIEYENQITAMVDRPGPDWASDAKDLEEARQAYENITVAAANFAREIDNLTHKQQTAQEQADKRIEKLKQWGSAETELLNKQREREEAGLEAAEHMGLITHEQFLALKLQADTENAEQRIALENRVQQAETYARQQEKAKSEYELHVAKEQLPKVSDTAHTAGAAVKRDEGKATNAQANLDKALEERKKIQDDIAELSLTVQHGDSATLGIWLAKKFGANINSPQQALAMLESRNDTNEATIGTLQNSLKKNLTELPELKIAAAAADEELEKTKIKIKTLTSRIAELGALIPESQARDQSSAANREANASSDYQTGLIKQGIQPPRGSEIINDPAAMASAEAGANAIMHGGRATALQAEQINTLVRLLQGLGESQSTAIKTIAAAHKNTEATHLLYLQLQRSVQQLGGQINSTGLNSHTTQ